MIYIPTELYIDQFNFKAINPKDRIEQEVLNLVNKIEKITFNEGGTRNIYFRNSNGMKITYLITIKSFLTSDIFSALEHSRFLGSYNKDLIITDIRKHIQQILQTHFKITL